MIASPCRLRWVALIGFLAVLLGALGAHGHVHDVVSSTGYLPQWETATKYHLVHTVALLLIALIPDADLARRLKPSFIAWIIGIVLFSGSLYVLSYTGIRWLGAITPLGGLSLMIGWLALMRAAKT